MDELTALTGDTTGGQVCKTLIHLVMADVAYVDSSKQGSDVCMCNSGSCTPTYNSYTHSLMQ